MQYLEKRMILDTVSPRGLQACHRKSNSGYFITFSPSLETFPNSVNWFHTRDHICWQKSLK